MPYLWVWDVSCVVKRLNLRRTRSEVGGPESIRPQTITPGEGTATNTVAVTLVTMVVGKQEVNELSVLVMYLLLLFLRLLLLLLFLFLFLLPPLLLLPQQ